jgi:hypothetical protein
MKNVKSVNADHAVEGLVGVWFYDIEDSPGVEITVRVVDGEVLVSETDTRDNEAFEVSDVSWDGESLRFVARVPSNNYRVENQLRLFGADSIKLRYTGTVPWRRTEASGRRASAMTHEERVSADRMSSEAFVGVWVDDMEDGPTAEISIRVVDGDVLVSEIDTRDNEASEISDISWDGQALRFVRRWPSTGYRDENELRLMGPDSITLRSTGTEQWERKKP